MYVCLFVEAQRAEPGLDSCVGGLTRTLTRLFNGRGSDRLSGTIVSGLEFEG